MPVLGAALRLDEVLHNLIGNAIYTTRRVAGSRCA